MFQDVPRHDTERTKKKCWKKTNGTELRSIAWNFMAFLSFSRRFVVRFFCDRSNDVQGYYRFSQSPFKLYFLFFSVFLFLFFSLTVFPFSIHSLFFSLFRTF